MDLLLEPPHGVGPVHLGMTFDEAMAAVMIWGEPRTRLRTGARRGSLSTSCAGVGVEVLLEEEDTVTAVELWWPGEGRETPTRALLHGLDVFRTPVGAVFDLLDAQGWRIHDAGGEDPFVAGLSLGFTRRTSQEVPREPGGLPVCFTSVLVGGESYYDFRI